MMLSDQTRATVLEALEFRKRKTLEFREFDPAMADEQAAAITTAITEIKAASAAGEWRDVEYNDIINVDNNNQIRVVIDQAQKDRRVHLHIRKRVDGKWKHVGVTTLLDDYRIQKRICEYIGSQSEANNEQ